MSIQGEIERINNNVQTTLNTIADTGVSVGTNSDALPAAASALANEKADKSDLTSHTGNTTVHVTAAERTAWNAKLDKLTYEYNKQLSCGSDGKVCLGVFGVYDTNITIGISSTTSATYNATLVIAAQNYFIKSATVYGDANNVVTPLLTIVASDNTSGSNYYRKVSVYANFPGWSKNIVSIKVVNPYSAPTSVLTAASTIPDANLYTPTNDIKSFVEGKGYVTSSDSVATATKLATARTFRTNLGSTATASFDGSSNVTPGVTGTLAIANGGTGANSAAVALNNLNIANSFLWKNKNEYNNVFSWGEYVEEVTVMSNTRAYYASNTNGFTVDDDGYVSGTFSSYVTGQGMGNNLVGKYVTLGFGSSGQPYKVLRVSYEYEEPAGSKVYYFYGLVLQEVVGRKINKYYLSTDSGEKLGDSNYTFVGCVGELLGST